MNPLVYAATIPAFKERIKGLLKCTPSSSEGHGIEQGLSKMEEATVQPKTRPHTSDFSL